jgi:hypothetical protein
MEVNKDIDLDNLSVYNEKELELLDKFLPLVQNAFDVFNILISLTYRKMNCMN